MRQIRLDGPESLYFSYGQLIAYDTTEQAPGSIWTDKHINQGFVRRPKCVGVCTLLKNGTARIAVFHGEPMPLEDYDRVLSVPINLPSGILHLEGPEEVTIHRSVSLSPGVFRIGFAQMLNSDANLRVDVFIKMIDEANPLSKLLKSDNALSESVVLCETGDAAT